MDNLIDLIATDESPSKISDGIKDILFAKAAEKIDEVKPQVAALLFNPGQEA